MTIDRTELERLLADRPTGNRSAMQAVRDSYDDIALMRERGLAWAEISGILARFGLATRDGQPFPAVTLRSAFFLVGNEIRSGVESGEGIEGEPAHAAVAAIHREVLRLQGIEDGDDAAAATVEDAVRDEAEIAPLPEQTPIAPSATEPPVGSEPEELSAAVTAEPEPVVAPVEETAEIPSASIDVGLSEPESPADAEILAVERPAETAPGPESALETFMAAAPSYLSPVEPPPDVLPADSRQPESNSRLPSEPLKGHHMLGTIFVLNDRGGVGKTLLSHHLMATAMLEGLQLRVVEYEVNERLARLYGPDVVEHRRITQDFMNMMGSGDGFYEYWDQIGPELQRGGRLYDFGGNISQWFFNWAEVSGFDYYVGQGERLTFMVPVTVDLASLQTGMATLDRIAVIAPKAKRVLVENGISGPFGQLDESQYGRRKAELVEREGVEVISMAPCTAPAWARLTGHRLDQVALMTREDLVKLGLTPPVASRSLIIIHEWLRNIRTALAPYIHEAFRQSSGGVPKPAIGGRGGE